jgi:tripartite-type tricarboxylate transporter receptor subunit TctC
MTTAIPVKLPTRVATGALAIALAATIGIGAGWSVPAKAQTYPVKPVRFIVAFAPGGPNDIMARVLAARLSQNLGQQFLVENRPGAGGIIGTDLVAKAPPDGYTVLFASAPFTMAPSLFAKIPYDTEKDFVAVTKVASSPMVLITNPSAPFKSVKELLDHAKTNPGKLNYGTGGIASTPHLATELFLLTAGIKMTHVPFKGGGPALVAVTAGEVDVLLDSITSTLTYIQGGKVRALAVSETKRSPKLPNVPTMQEAGLGTYSMTHWVGVVAPSRTPGEIINKLHVEIAKALTAEDVKSRYADIGAEPVGDSPAEFQAFLKTELERWPKVVKEARIDPQ